MSLLQIVVVGFFLSYSVLLWFYISGDTVEICFVFTVEESSGP